MAKVTATVTVGNRLFALVCGAWIAGTAAAGTHAETVPATALTACARVELDRWLQPRSTRHELRPTAGVRGLVLNEVDGRIELVARPLAVDELPTARMTVWIEVRSGSRTLRTVGVPFAVKAFQHAWVAARDLRLPQANLRDGALIWQAVDAAAVGGPLAGTNLAGLRLRRPLLAGQVLTTRHLEVISAVSPGERATLHTRAGGLSLDTEVQVLRSGQPGDLVTVLAPRAAGPVMAKVLGPGSLEWVP